MRRWVTYREALDRHPRAVILADHTARASNCDPHHILILLDGEDPVAVDFAVPQDIPQAPRPAPRSTPVAPNEALVTAARAVLAARDAAAWEEARQALARALEGLPGGV